MQQEWGETRLYAYKQEKLIRWAEQERLARQCQGRAQGDIGPILLRVGDALITAGQHLKTQSKSQTNLQSV